MKEQLEAVNILISNTPQSKMYDLRMLLENAEEQVHSSLLNELYDQINSLRKIDFKEIDKSRGEYDKLSFYEDIEKAHHFLEQSEEVAVEMSIIKQAEINILKMKNTFVDGYMKDADITILTYESVVLSIVDATSTAITISATNVVKNRNACSSYSFEILKRYNKSVEEGKADAALRKVNEQAMFLSGNDTTVKEVFMTGMSLFLGTIIILAFIPMIREAIFFFYHLRMTISDYLEQLAFYIKINEVEVQHNPDFDAAKKKSIIDRQNMWIEKLEWLSDKIRVAQAQAEKKAEKEIEEKNKDINIKKIKDDTSEVDPPSSDGFDF